MCALGPLLGNGGLSLRWGAGRFIYRLGIQLLARRSGLHGATVWKAQTQLRKCIFLARYKVCGGGSLPTPTGVANMSSIENLQMVVVVVVVAVGSSSSSSR